MHSSNFTDDRGFGRVKSDLGYLTLGTKPLGILSTTFDFFFF